MSLPHQNEEPMERHNPTLASTRVHVLDLCPKKASCFRFMFSSSIATPFMRLGYFTKFYPSCSTSRFALNGWPVCARPPASQSLRHRVELVRMSGDLGLGSGGLMLEWGSPGEEGVVPLGSAVRQLTSFVQPVDQLRWVGHVSGPAVRGCDDLAARSASVISFFPPQVDLLEAPDGGVEDEVLRLTAV
ncbi:hypothetical protein BHE74_00007343 [Ensete ventricosum]|nr:hypothetical protein BHE74_00007343 [Ensete ventricosum]